MAECLRSELQLYGITVHCYFAATILSPGLENENKTKPTLTKEIEGTDEGQTPDRCATWMVQGLEQGYFSITDGLIGNVLRISGGCAPGNTFFYGFTDSPSRSRTLLNTSEYLTQWALLGWRRYIADRTILKYRQKSVS